MPETFESLDTRELVVTFHARKNPLGLLQPSQGQRGELCSVIPYFVHAPHRGENIGLDAPQTHPHPLQQMEEAVADVFGQGVGSWDVGSWDCVDSQTSNEIKSFSKTSISR